MKISRKTFLITFILICLLVGLIWWFKGANNSPLRFGSAELKLGLVDFPGYAGFYLADQTEAFKKAGIDVEIVKYNSLTDLSLAYRQGDIHGAILTNYQAVYETINGLDHRVIMLVDRSKGADGIISSRSYQKVSDLVGKKVAYEFGTLEEYIISSALAETGHRLESVIGVNIAADQAAASFNRGEVEAAVTYEPFMSEGLAQNPKARILWATDENPSLIFDVLTINEDYIIDNADRVSKLVEVYFSIMGKQGEDNQLLVEALALEFNISVEEAKGQLSGVEISRLKDNQDSFTPGIARGSIYDSLENVLSFFQNSSQVNARINIDSIVDSSFMISN